MNRYGLVGYPLGHSFSKSYFSEKFDKRGISSSHTYELFEIEFLKDFPSIWERYPDLRGVNVTIPHKINIKNFLDQLDPSAHKVGAVNVVKKKAGKLVGYNADYMAFKRSLESWLDKTAPEALILGSGGASLAVQAGLDELDISYDIASRFKDKGDYLYTEFFKDESLFGSYDLIINTTPVGMSPDISDGPPIPYEHFHKDQHVYDLIYNPEKTLFLAEAEKQGAKIKNGMEMLELQAERAWEIWTDPEL